MARFTNVTALLNNSDFTPAQVQALRELVDAIVDDRANISASLTALDTALDAMATKLNADTGVNDTDYAGAATAMTVATGLTGLPG